jgi:nicotinamidase/pyrazinamidase
VLSIDKPANADGWHPELPAGRYGAEVALVVVDVQNDFADPAGSLSVKGGADVVPFANAEMELALAAGSPIAYTQDWHPAHTQHFAQDGGTWPVHCVAGTWGAELSPGLRVMGPVVRKGTRGEDGYSGFSMRDFSAGMPIPTELDATLSGWGVRRLVIVGLATDYCVLMTALDAIDIGYETAVLLDGVRAVDVAPGDGDAAIAKMAGSGIRVVGRRD